ncbi:MAG: S-methyl-5'-thioadenosine phosphorylase [Candidatus Dadabacteria bacterium]|nr:S-methyl-5'-thioadenosine phosphorylase [Candidatus Dadabacteria bacterium]
MNAVGIIGGSGLYGMSGFDTAQSVEVSTPWGDPSGPLTTGEMGGVPLIFLPRHGPGHTLLPSEINYRANIYALKSLGAGRVISVSAVGSMKESIKPGDIVIPSQFIDHTKNRANSFFGGGAVAHVSMADPVCHELGAALVTAAKNAGAATHDGGTYICIEGPQFSSRAESHVYRTWGADVIGMTNMPEAKLAREAEMCYATLAMATDYDCWHPGHDAVTVEDIIETLTANVETAKTVIKKTIESLGSGGGCACRLALENAIITQPDMISDETKKKLGVVAERALK